MSFKITIGRTAITNEDIYTNEAIVAFIPKKQSISIMIISVCIYQLMIGLMDK